MKYATDIVFLAGLAIAAAGLWLVYPPAALIAVGAVLMAGSVMAARRGTE